MAFKDLKSRGIIESVVGKGYFVKSNKVHLKYKVFLLFDELNAFKEDLYNAFINGLENNVQVDIYFHHFNEEVFSTLIKEKAREYNYYVIMPANLANIRAAISQLPQDKVYILDQLQEELRAYAAIYQNFKDNIRKGLAELLEDIRPYQSIVLVFNSKNQPSGIKEGFELFCQDHHVPYEIAPGVPVEIERRKVYLILDDKELIAILKELRSKNLRLGKDVGIVAYNETPLKEIVGEGITTISTDFAVMGEGLADMIQSNATLQIENPMQVIKRNSL